jgi:DNA adenine methylase
VANRSTSKQQARKRTERSASAPSRKKTPSRKAKSSKTLADLNRAAKHVVSDVERLRGRLFVKWAGGKSKLVPKILELMPAFSGAYHEPFVGGGAVFAALASRQHFGNAHLNDLNWELIAAYRAIRENRHELVHELKKLRGLHDEKTYYLIRAKKPIEVAKIAARFIYLNKTCFNGLYRVNAKGEFNVPIGSYKNPQIFDEDVLHWWSKQLQSVKLHAHDFSLAIARAEKGDFIYCDPPYLPKSETGNFTSYTKEKFGIGEHDHLFRALDSATEHRVKWMLSEGDSPFIRNLFKKYNIHAVSVQHAIAASGDARGKRRELLITNY